MFRAKRFFCLNPGHRLVMAADPLATASHENAKFFRFCKGLQKLQMFAILRFCKFPISIVNTLVSPQNPSKMSTSPPGQPWPRRARGKKRSFSGSYKVNASRSFDFVDFPLGAALGSSYPPDSNQEQDYDLFAFWLFRHSLLGYNDLGQPR